MAPILLAPHGAGTGIQDLRDARQQRREPRSICPWQRENPNPWEKMTARPVRSMGHHPLAGRDAQPLLGHLEQPHAHKPFCTHGSSHRAGRGTQLACWAGSVDAAPVPL